MDSTNIYSDSKSSLDIDSSTFDFDSLSESSSTSDSLSSEESTELTPYDRLQILLKYLKSLS